MGCPWTRWCHHPSIWIICFRSRRLLRLARLCVVLGPRDDWGFCTVGHISRSGRQASAHRDLQVCKSARTHVCRNVPGPGGSQERSYSTRVIRFVDHISELQGAVSKIPIVPIIRARADEDFGDGAQFSLRAFSFPQSPASPGGHVLVPCWALGV
jgi:hypothetical protein